MTVYVDDPVHPFGRMLMCHMFAGTIAELFEMVDRIGVQRKWLQRPEPAYNEPWLIGMDASWVHFDISKAKRKLAVSFGAIEVDQLAALEFRAAQDILTGDPLRSSRALKTLLRVANARRLRAQGY